MSTPTPKPGPPRRSADAASQSAAPGSQSAVDDGRAATSRMASFAKLNADWQVDEKSYLDNFIDFILGAMAAKGLVDATPEQMADAVAAIYGLRFPVTVTHQIARRAARRGQLKSIGSGRYVPDEEAIGKARIHASTVQGLEREQAKLAKLFVEWVHKEVAGSEIAQERALPVLMDYVETFYGSLMSTHQGRGSIPERPAVNPSDETRLAAGFITYLSQGEPEAFDYVLNIAKGSMLSASLFTPGAKAEARPFRDTILLLDTRIVLRMLGYEGDAPRAAAVDYLQLAASQGARLGCFEITLAEIRSIFWSADAAARSGELWQWELGSVGSYFWNKGLGAGEISLASGTLREDIERAGVTIVGSPGYGDVRHVVSEEAVESALLHLSPKYSPAALRHDVQALSAIVRMRAGLASGSLEECRAVFVTSNSFMVRAGRRVEDMKHEPWFVSILDTDLASLTWIKTPLGSPDLPRGSLVATCLSVLSPSDVMWGKYIAALERRHAAGEISGAELLIARRITEEKRVKLSAHQYESDEAVSKSIDMTLQEARTTYEAELSEPYRQREANLLASVQAEKEERERTLADLESIRAETDLDQKKRREAAGKRADRAAVWVASIAWLVCVAVVLVGLLAPLPSPAPVIFTIIGGVLVVTGGASAFIGPLRKSVRAKFHTAELKRVGLADTP